MIKPSRAYKFGWIIIAGLALLATLLHFVPLPLERKTRCMMQLATGLYCPGCGGTRSVLAFLMGYIKVSFYFHPLILYSASVFATYMLTSTITYLSKGKVNLLIGFQSIFIYIGFGIIMANWIVRDILLVVYHIPIG